MAYITGSNFSNRLVEYCCIYGHARAAFRHSGQAGGPTLLESDLKGECYRRVPSVGSTTLQQTPSSPSPPKSTPSQLRKSVSTSIEERKGSESLPEQTVVTDDSEFPFGVELFVFPTGVHLSRTKKPPSFHSFVLTVGDGSRVYGYAFISHRRLHAKKLSIVRMQIAAMLMSKPDAKVTDMPQRLWVPEAVVLLSRHPYHRQFSRLMNAFCLHHIPTGDDSEHLSGELVKTLYKSLNFPAPVPQSPPLSITLCDATAVFEAKSSEDPPLAECDFRLLCGAMEPRRVITVITALMCEMPVLLYSTHMDILTPALEAIQALVYPLKWPYIYIPLLPVSLVDILEAPQPYLIGAPSQVLNEPPWPADALLIDLDNNTMSCPRKLQPMPWRLSWRLYDCMVKHFNVFQILHPGAQLSPPDGLPDSAKVRGGFGITFAQGHNGGSREASHSGSSNNQLSNPGPQQFMSSRISAVMTLKTVNTLHDGSEPDDSDDESSEDSDEAQQTEDTLLEEEEEDEDKDQGHEERKGVSKNQRALGRGKRHGSLEADYVLVAQAPNSPKVTGRGHSRRSAADSGTHAPAAKQGAEMLPMAGPNAPTVSDVALVPSAHALQQRGSAEEVPRGLRMPSSFVDSFVGFFRFKAAKAKSADEEDTSAPHSAAASQPVKVRVRPERLRKSFLSVFVSLFKHYRQHIEVLEASSGGLSSTPSGGSGSAPSFFSRQASNSSAASSSSSSSSEQRPGVRRNISNPTGRNSPILSPMNASGVDSPNADEDLHLFSSNDFLEEAPEDLRPFLSMLVETQMFHEFIVERLQATVPDWFDSQVLKRVTREAEAHRVNRERPHSGLLWKIGSQIPTWHERLFMLDGMLLVYSKPSDKIEHLKHKAKTTKDWADVRPKDAEAHKRMESAEKELKEHMSSIEKGRLELVEGCTDVTVPSDSQQYSSIFSTKLKTPFVFVVTIFEDATKKTVKRRLVCCAHTAEGRREWIKVIQARVHAPKPLFRLFKPEKNVKRRMQKKKNRMLERTLTHVRQVQLRKGARLASIVQEEDELETESDRDSSTTQ